MPLVIGGRFGLASKEFTPAMAAAVFAELAKPAPKNHFTVGIVDDVSGTSLTVDRSFSTEPDDVVRAVFYGLGSDGTVGANKNSVKIIGESTPLHAQGYFVYDSRKAGAVTISHLRFGPRPIRSSYLIEQPASSRAISSICSRRWTCSLSPSRARTFLLNSSYGPDEVWDQLPVDVQQEIIDKRLRFFVVDGYADRPRGRARGTDQHRPPDVLLRALGRPARGGGDRRDQGADPQDVREVGDEVLTQNAAAVDRAIGGLHEVRVPKRATSTLHREGGRAGGRSRLRRACDRDDPRRQGRPRCRSARSLRTARSRPAPPASTSAAPPSRSRSGIRRSASTARSARSSAPTRRYA